MNKIIISNYLKLNTILKTVAVWLLVYSSVFISFHIFIEYDNLKIAIPYFIVINTIIFLLFKNIFRTHLSNIRNKHYLFLTIAFIFHATAYWVCNTYLGEPTKLLETNTASFILVNEYFLWAKPIDILVQQLMIFLLVWKLDKLKLNLKQITLLMVTIFGAGHIYSVQHMEIVPTLLLTVLTTIIAVLFPYLILRVKNGLLYNFMIHLIAVDVLALLIWVLF